MGVVGVQESPQRPVPRRGRCVLCVLLPDSCPLEVLNEWKGGQGGCRMSKERKGWAEEGEQTCAHVSIVCESVLVQSEW